MDSNLLVLRNATALKNTQAFFLSHNIKALYQEISKSESLNVDLLNTKADIILVTSQNALDVLKNNINKISFKKIYCLNSIIAKNLKVDNVVPLGWNNTKELAEYIIKNEQPNQKIVHLCADNANKLFYGILKKAGFKIEEINVYKTIFKDNFSDEILSKLKQNKIKYVMVFSKQSLNAINKIFTKNNLNLKNYKLICFSKSIADGYSNLYANNSTLDEMLKIYKEEENG